MAYTLSRRDKATFDIMPALEMLEKFVEKKKLEREFSQVSSLVAESFKNVDKKTLPETLINTTNTILTSNYNPEIKNRALSLISTLGNLYEYRIKSEEEEKRDREKAFLGSGILSSVANKYYSYDGEIVTGKELADKLKSRYVEQYGVEPSEDIIANIVKNQRELVVDEEISFSKDMKTLKVNRVLIDPDTKERVISEPLYEAENILDKNKLKIFKYKDGQKEEVQEAPELLQKGILELRRERSREEEEAYRWQERNKEKAAKPMVISSIVPIKIGNEVLPEGSTINLYTKTDDIGRMRFYYEDEKGNLVEVKKVVEDREMPLTIHDVSFNERSGRTTKVNLNSIIPKSYGGELNTKFTTKINEILPQAKDNKGQPLFDTDEIKQIKEAINNYVNKKDIKVDEFVEYLWSFKDSGKDGYLKIETIINALKEAINEANFVNKDAIVDKLRKKMIELEEQEK